LTKRRSNPGPYLLHLDLLPERVPPGDPFPFNLPAVRGLSRLPFHRSVTYLIGENGSGKSTLLEAIAVATGLNAEGGSRNFQFSTRDSSSGLEEAIRLAQTLARPADSYFLRAESFFNVASEIERLDVDDPTIASNPPPIINSYGGRSLHEQSHGESFFALFRHRFGGCGLYFLDEPEAALSPMRQLEFLRLLHRHVRGGSQFVIATHSPIVLAYPDAMIYELDANGIRETTYTKTPHYLVTRGFLSNPQRSLDDLLAE
jgi:predicted ATPase